MRLRRNAFYTFAVLVFLVCMLFSIVCVFQRLGSGQEYPYLVKGEWLLTTLVFFCLLLSAGTLWSRLEVSRRLKEYGVLCSGIEGILAALFLGVGFSLRLYILRNMPMQPSSDYKTYYEIAELICKGTLTQEGKGYCDYISMFPHVYGYPAVLAIVFRLFGTSVKTALLFNLAAQMGNCILVWRIARLLGGRFSGLVSLALISLLPSAILFSDFVASEPFFTLVLLSGILLFLHSLRNSPRKEEHPWLCTAELVASGIMLAFGSFIRPMALIFLVAALICTFSGEISMPDMPPHEVPLGFRATGKGWKRCLILLAVYFLTSSFFTARAAYASDRELAGGSASYGYNLLVGLNLQSYGGWNQEDADYLYDALEETGSAREAQLICRDMALVRAKADPRALLDLFVHKFEVLWGNDDFGASWNILFMDQQGTLSPQRESFFYRMMDISDLYYLSVLLLALIFGCMMLKRKPDSSYSLVLLFCGTVALHLFVENQNRYHYHAIPVLIILSGIAVSAILQNVYQFVMEKLEEQRRLAAEKERSAQEAARKAASEEEISRLRAEALHAQFDMAKAIREGHIRIVASKGVADAEIPEAYRRDPQA